MLLVFIVIAIQILLKNQLIKLYKEEINNNFVQNNNPITNLNNIIDFFVQNKINNVLTRFVYDLTKNKEIESFLGDNNNNIKKEKDNSKNLDENIFTEVSNSNKNNEKLKNFEAVNNNENINIESNNNLIKNINIKENNNKKDENNIIINIDSKTTEKPSTELNNNNNENLLKKW